MHVLIDADALPRAIKEIVFRAAKRVPVKWTMVANKRLYIPPDIKMDMLVVAKNPDEADDRIVTLIGAGDLVVTSDIPLADRAISKGAFALSPKGAFHTESNIKSRLATRDLLAQLRDEGEIKCVSAPFSAKDCQAFSNKFESFLAKRLKEEEREKEGAKPGIWGQP